MISEKRKQELDPEVKKKVSNEKRLKAISEWKKNRIVPRTDAKPVHKVFNDDDDNVTSQHKLFDSDEEEEEAYEENFKIRPQFEGPHGQQLLEMSAALSGRFKLDERFREDDNEVELEPSEKNEEKEKNIKILESILGHQIPIKSTEKSSPRKRQVRFDPEDESSSKYVKDVEENPVEKPKKKRSKKENADKVEPNIPISTDHYIEVSSNLKDILSSTSTQFSLTKQFNFDADVEMLEPVEKNDYTHDKKKAVEDRTNMNNSQKEKVKSLQTCTKNISSYLKRDNFFISENDPRLKEGIQFFKRPRPLDAIRIEWQARREPVLEMFRRKSKSSQRSRTTSVRTIQKKNLLRKQNFNR